MKTANIEKITENMKVFIYRNFQKRTQFFKMENVLVTSSDVNGLKTSLRLGQHPKD